MSDEDETPAASTPVAPAPRTLETRAPASEAEKQKVG